MTKLLLLKNALRQNTHNDQFVKACVSIVMAREAEDWFILMIKRTDHQDDPWSGQYAFPGGKKEADESPFECVVRESFEEVGLELSKDELIGCSDDFSPIMKPELVIRPYLFLCRQRVGLTNDKREVASSYWLPLSLMMKPEHHKRQVFKTSLGEKELGSIEFDGHVIWGISYMILNDLLKRLCDLEYLPSRYLRPLIWSDD